MLVFLTHDEHDTVALGNRKMNHEWKRLRSAQHVYTRLIDFRRKISNPSRYIIASRSQSKPEQQYLIKKQAEQQDLIKKQAEHQHLIKKQAEHQPLMKKRAEHQHLVKKQAEQQLVIGAESQHLIKKQGEQQRVIGAERHSISLRTRLLGQSVTI